MNPQEFCYWLQGYFELHDEEEPMSLTPSQVSVIKDHLKLVFHKVTPTYEKAAEQPPPLGLADQDKRRLFEQPGLFDKICQSQPSQRLCHQPAVPIKMWEGSC